MDKEEFIRNFNSGSLEGMKRGRVDFERKENVFKSPFEDFDLGHGEFSMVMRLVISNERERHHLNIILDEKENTPEKHQERQEKLGILIKKAIKEPLSLDELVDLQNCLS